jgi:hypothetical protein
MSFSLTPDGRVVQGGADGHTHDVRLSETDTERLKGLLAADRAAWPLGHPCRNCDHLAIDHPIDHRAENATVDCEEWR